MRAFDLRIQSGIRNFLRIWLGYHAFADEYGGGRWHVRCAGKDDLRLALAELATPIGFEFTDDEKKNADLQFERTRRELKKLADAREPHRCLLLLGAASTVLRSSARASSRQSWAGMGWLRPAQYRCQGHGYGQSSASDA
jgi:hypothetical protein